jgi:2-keto-4-pentenoate hydratase
MDPTQTRQAAAWLAAEHQAGRRFEPFAAAQGIATLADAYAVQREYIASERARRGAGVAGYKIGLTSAAMQKMCGIDTPVAGVILDDGVHANEDALRASRYGRLGVEFEIAVRFKEDLPADGGTPTFDEVAHAVDAVAPAMEIVDDRGCDYARLDVLSLVADNAWNAGLVLGPFVREWPALDEVEGVAQVVGGETLGSGRGADALGHPFLACAWLASHLAARGECLRAGQVVMTGSIVTTRFPVAGMHLRFEVGALGTVEAHVQP